MEEWSRQVLRSHPDLTEATITPTKVLWVTGPSAGADLGDLDGADIPVRQAETKLAKIGYRVAGPWRDFEDPPDSGYMAAAADIEPLGDQ